MTGNVSVQGQLTGLPSGNKVLGPLTVAPSSSNDYEEYTITLANGFNAIPVPSWAAGCLIVPASTNAVPMTLKGVTGDTGIPLSLTDVHMINFAVTPPSSIGITSTGAGATVTTFIFY
jgi:hypothetical protein